MQPQIIHEDRDFIVLVKPAGMAVHGGVSVRGQTVTDWLVRKHPEIKKVGDDPKERSAMGEARSSWRNERPGIVHRLDKDTSGVLLVARSKRAFEDLKQLFKERKIEKTYLALVIGAPKPATGTIDAPIGRLIANPLKRGIGARMRGSRQAVTEYRVLERLGDYSLLAVKPKTGRMHQIRVHLASLGHPVAGDRVYGRPWRASLASLRSGPTAGGARAELPGLDRQFLHAWRLAFSYPEGRRWQFEAALPPDLDAVLKRLRRLRKRP